MQHRSNVKYTCAAIIWTVVVLWVLLFPKRQAMVAVAIPVLDKVVHFLLFAILTFLVTMAIRERRRKVVFWKLFVILSLYGVATEVAQPIFSNRLFELWDMFADIAGVAFVILVFKSKFDDLSSQNLS